MLRPERRVIFLDTDGVDGARENPTVSVTRNAGEAALLLRAAGALVAGGLLATALGAISPYRAQVRICADVRIATVI